MPGNHLKVVPVHQPVSRVGVKLQVQIVLEVKVQPVGVLASLLEVGDSETRESLGLFVRSFDHSMQVAALEARIE